MERTEFQALVTGAVMGALLKAPENGLLIDVEPVMDEDGYTNEIRVEGRESRERLIITVDRLEP